MGSESDAVAKKNDANAPLKSLGKYQIERKLGQGGMGTVYLAMNTDLKKLVALKVLPRDKAQNPILVRRFKAEAQAAGQLEHPNIVAVYDTGEADGYLYIAMEYVEGIDLFEQVKRRGVIPVKRSIEIIKQVAMALQHAFEHNIVHRDIKPSNLLLKQDGTVKVTDLGLARSIDDTLETNITRAGTTVGTVDYMSPEQARNSKSADVRSDIYSLGCTWYQMLTGEPPYSEGSVTNKLQAHAMKPLPDPRELNENIPEGLIAVLHRMTAKKPADRYQTPAELLEDLAQSKLTKAQFSNEIFSDLSDYDMDAGQRFDGSSDLDEEDVAVEEEAPRRKKRPSDDDSPVNEEPAKSARKKPRSRVEDADLDEESEPRPRKKSSVNTPEAQEDSAPLKSRSKPISKPRNEDFEEDSDDEPRRSKSAFSDDEPEEPSSRTKRRPKSNSESPSSGSKSDSESRAEKNSSSQNGKRSGPHVPKPLPPKSLPTPSDDENRSKLNLDFLRYAGIAASFLAVIGGLGWLIATWSGQVETANPFPAKTETPADPVVVTKPTPKRTESNETEDPSLVLVEPTKPPPVEKITSNEFDISKQPLPAWATSNAVDAGELPVITVGPGTTSPIHFSHLDDALRSADKAGAVVRLIGNGPFLLSKVDLGNAKRLVITAATPQDQPLIVVAPSAPGGGCGLTMTNGSLDLRGLHFVFDRSGNDIQLNAMLSVTDGQLFVRRCSFTATGDETIAATALGFSSKQDSQNITVVPPDVLLDHVTIRGNGLTGLKVDRTTADIVVQDSLLVTGTAPALDISGTLATGISDAIESRPRRLFRIIRSTFSGRNKILELAATNSTKPPLTAIYFLDSICSAEGAGNSAVLLSATRWPSISSTAAGWLTHLSWTSRSSLYIGFERLIDLDKASYKVTSVDDWQRVWGGKKVEKAQFQSLTWQESPISDLSNVMPHDFDTARFPFHEVTTSKGAIPGCATRQLVVPSFISPARLAAMGHRPKLPPVAAMPAEGPLLRRVNLQKEDLGLILNRNDWPSGAVFEATGSGLQTMVPAKIIGKSVKIIFRQGDGAPLKLQPKIADQKGKADNLGLFSIEKGTLELQSAMLEAMQVPKSASPPWIIFARNANLILRGCQLNGPLLQDLPQYQGLIDWGMSSPLQQSLGVESNYLLVNDSLLMSTGVGIRFQGASGNLFVRNSIIAVRGFGIDLQPMRIGNDPFPVVDLRQVTFSASKAAIRVEAASGNDAISAPMKLFVEHCAVVMPLEFKPGEAVESAVVECAGPVIEQKQVEWWGTSNGFAKEIKSLLRQSGTEPIVTTAGWNGVWGDSNEIRLLTGTKGVQLRSHLPGKWTNFKATSFLLDPASAAATWADGGLPIGADIRMIEESILSKKGVETKPGPSTKSSPSTQGNKKNPGF